MHKLQIVLFVSIQSRKSNNTIFVLEVFFHVCYVMHKLHCRVSGQVKPGIIIANERDDSFIVDKRRLVNQSIRWKVKHVTGHEY